MQCTPVGGEWHLPDKETHYATMYVQTRQDGKIQRLSEELVRLTVDGQQQQQQHQGAGYGADGLDYGADDEERV